MKPRIRPAKRERGAFEEWVARRVEAERIEAESLPRREAAFYGVLTDPQSTEADIARASDAMLEGMQADEDAARALAGPPPRQAMTVAQRGLLIGAGCFIVLYLAAHAFGRLA